MKCKRHILFFVALLVASMLGPVEAGAEIGTLKCSSKGVEGRLSFLRSHETRPERAGLVSDGNTIIATSSRKKIVLFNQAGQKLNEIKIKFSPVSTPAVYEDKLYAGGADGVFYCLDLQTGKIIWSKELKTIDFSAPSVSRDKVIFQTAKDLVVALDKDSGEWRWQYQHLRPDDLGVRGLGRPLITDSTVFIGLSGGFVAAFRLEDGALLWKTRAFRGELFKDVDPELLADQTSVYAVSLNGQTASLSRRTGKVYWTFPAGGTAGAALEGDIIYLINDEAEALALDKVTGKLLWKRSLIEKKQLDFNDLFTRPLVLEQFLVCLNRSGALFILDKTKGEVLGHNKFRVKISSPALNLGGDSFVFLDNRGVVHFCGF